MSFFERILPWTLRHEKTLLFTLVWITITLAAAIWMAFAVGQLASPTSQKATSRPVELIPWRQAGTPRSVIALALLAVLLTSYIAMILMWEDFTYYDNSFFTLFTLKGHNLPLAIDPEHGRFWPLGLQEFNLIRWFTDTAAGYHVVPIMQLLLFSWILAILDDELKITTRAALVIFALVIPSILISFNGLIFQERDVLFFLTCFVLSVKRFDQTQSIVWAIAAVLCAQFMIYNKETAFLLLLAFALSRLVLGCRNLDVRGWDFSKVWLRKSRLDACFVCLAALFLISYLSFVGSHVNMNYAASERLPPATIVRGYTGVDLLPWLLLAVILRRIYLMLRHRAAPLLLWDGLAFGGLACFLGYLYLGIFSVYYLAPVDLVAALYIGRFAVLSWPKMSAWRRIAGTLLAFLVVFQNVLVSSFSLYERKNVIHGKAEIASAVKSHFRRGTGNPLRLFFPFAGSFRILEFGAYLDYRDVPVEGASDDASSPASIVLAEARRTRAKNSPQGPFEDAPCVEWSRIWCQIVNEPAPGDLVIVLPDDEAPLAEASVYRERGELLFWYEPRPSVPHWLSWLFDCLPIGRQSGYRYDKLPDRWMDGSVTMWK